MAKEDGKFRKFVGGYGYKSRWDSYNFQRVQGRRNNTRGDELSAVEGGRRQL